MPYALLADTVLALHAGVVLFVTLGLLAVPLGHARGWPWVRGCAWRLAHAVAMAVVVVQAWRGEVCPLTTLESWLRREAGQTPYELGFVAHWLQRLIYFEAPIWVFALLYTAVAALVAWTWWRVPPRCTRRA